MSACACIWFTARSGHCQAIDSPLAVLSPVDKLPRIPGPRVTEMKVGFWRRVSFPSVRMGIVNGRGVDSRGGSGRKGSALAIRVARFC